MAAFLLVTLSTPITTNCVSIPVGCAAMLNSNGARSVSDGTASGVKEAQEDLQVRRLVPLYLSDRLPTLSV